MSRRDDPNQNGHGTDLLIHKNRNMKSMTGYGEAQARIDGRTMDVIAKSVNHKYFTFSPHLPEALKPFEAEFEAVTKDIIERGRVELDVQLDIPVEDGRDIVNPEKAETFRNALKQLQNKLDLAGEITVETVVEGPGVVPEEEVEDRNWIRNHLEKMKDVTREAVSNLDKNRKEEGAELKNVLQREIEAFDEGVQQVNELVPEMVENYRKRLTEKIEETSLDDLSEEERELFNRELQMFIDKVDVTEELDRLASHVKQFRESLEQNGAIGRKLDFIAQELLRETNTVAAKSKHAEIGQIVVELKSSLGRIREQTENIE